MNKADMATAITNIDESDRSCHVNHGQSNYIRLNVLGLTARERTTYIAQSLTELRDVYLNRIREPAVSN